MSEPTSSKFKGEEPARSPVLFAALWFGIPLTLVIVGTLVMNHFGL